MRPYVDKVVELVLKSLKALGGVKFLFHFYSPIIIIMRHIPIGI